MICLNKRQILFLHEELIRETGGSPGLRDEAAVVFSIRCAVVISWPF